MNNLQIKKIRNKTLLIIFIIIVIIGGLRSYNDIKRNNNIIKKENELVNNIIKNILQNELVNINKLFIAKANILSNSDKVKNLILTNKKDELFNYTLKYYTFFNSVLPNFNLFNMYNIDSSYILKHNQNNNLKSHEMILSTIKEKSPMAGFNNSDNILNYKFSFPIFHNSKLISVLEIGVDTTFIINKIEEYLLNTHDKDVKIITLLNNVKNKNDFFKFKNYFYSSDINIKNILNNKNNKNNKNDSIIKIKKKYYYLNWNKLKVKNYKGNNIGSFLYIIDITKDMKKNNHFFYSSIMKPIMASIVILLIIFIIFQYFSSKFLLMQNETRLILDTQSSLILLTDGYEIKDCNKSFLDFFKVKNLDSLLNKYKFISKLFLEDSMIIENKTNAQWLDYLLKNKNKIHKIKLKNNTFKVTARSYINEYTKTLYYVVTLTNISDLENINAKMILQSKQASLGDMIANIAHQWRQPLSTISTVASSITLKSKMDILDKNNLESNMDLIVNKTTYLSNTIETFRNFIQEDKIKQDVILQDRISMALDIVYSSLKDNHIKLINNTNKTENIHINLVIGELAQVIINIVSNAKDILIERKTPEPTIEISLKQENNKVLITIEDNAGGILNNIISKIFDPYFTTKHKAQGTGLGLYMSYKIMSESLNGNLYVKNSKKGAIFFIELPL